jgi:hypothetical protein
VEALQRRSSCRRACEWAFSLTVVGLALMAACSLRRRRGGRHLAQEERDQRCSVIETRERPFLCSSGVEELAFHLTPSCGVGFRPEAAAAWSESRNERQRRRAADGALFSVATLGFVVHSAVLAIELRNPVEAHE